MKYRKERCTRPSDEDKAQRKKRSHYEQGRQATTLTRVLYAKPQNVDDLRSYLPPPPLHTSSLGSIKELTVDRVRFEGSDSCVCSQSSLYSKPNYNEGSTLRLVDNSLAPSCICREDGDICPCSKFLKKPKCFEPVKQEECNCGLSKSCICREEGNICPCSKYLMELKCIDEEACNCSLSTIAEEDSEDICRCDEQPSLLCTILEILRNPYARKLLKAVALFLIGLQISKETFAWVIPLPVAHVTRSYFCPCIN